MADTAASSGVLHGRYHVGEVVAREPFVVTRRGHDALLLRDVAVVMPDEALPGAVARERLELTREMLTGLDHPALPRVFDAGTVDSRPYVIAEQLDGEILSQGLDAAPVAEVGAALADLLAYLHERGLVLGAVQPGDVRLQDDGRVRVAAFGIARSSDSADDVASLGRLLRAVAPEGSGRLHRMLDRMTAPAAGERPSATEARAHLELLTAEALTEPLTQPLTAVIAVLPRPRPHRAWAVALTTAATLAGVLLVAPSWPDGTGEAAAGSRPTPTPTPTADAAAVPVVLEPPTTKPPEPQHRSKEKPKKAKGKHKQEPGNRGKG